MEQVIANGLYLGAQYALIALGLTLIFALMNVLNFAHGQMYVLGGFVTYEVYGLMKLPFVVALLASALTLAVLGALIERFLFRTVIRRSEREESTMLLAAGVAYFLDAAILLLFGEKQRGVPKIVNGIFFWDNLILPWDRIVVAGLAVLFIVAFILMMQFTKPGRAMRALAQDRVAAQLMGVPVAFYGLVGFALGAMLAGLVGGLLVDDHRRQFRHRRADLDQGLHDGDDRRRGRRRRRDRRRLHPRHAGVGRPHGPARLWRHHLSRHLRRADDLPRRPPERADGQAVGMSR